MLYLEDYLEMIEHLPQELKDRFTEIRELDLQVQNATDKLEDRVKLFFKHAKKEKTPERESEFVAIRAEYYKVLEDADEKVHQANQMYELVDKYLRKLDQELNKFKMELEADNAGITEVLEKRSLEMDMQFQTDRDRDRVDYLSQKENRYMTLIKSEKKSERKNSHEKLGFSNFGSVSGTASGHVSGTSTPISYMGISGNAIAAAASQAIAATQQMGQGRRTASLKSSYDGATLGLGDYSMGRELLAANAELHQAAQTALAATGCATGEQKRNKRKSHHTHNVEMLAQPADELVDSDLVMDTTETAEWSTFVDPSEPRYCICNEVSYGDMVACDNTDCPIEWFHYGCVGITSTPRGKWYCPQCAAAMKRRGRR